MIRKMAACPLRFIGEVYLLEIVSFFVIRTERYFKKVLKYEKCEIINNHFIFLFTQKKISE